MTVRNSARKKKYAKKRGGKKLQTQKKAEKEERHHTSEGQGSRMEEEGGVRLEPLSQLVIAAD